MPNGEKFDRYNIESSILTNLFNIGSNLAIPLLQKKWLEHWTFELKADLLPVFLSKIENGSEIYPTSQNKCDTAQFQTF